MQKILIVSTDDNRLRGKVVGWTYENGDVLMESVRRFNSCESMPGYDRLDIPVGLIGGSLYFPKYPTILHAIGDGWKLLAPPEEYKEVNGKIYYEWWLVKD